MKILIASLQVSEGASKGHLHPAIELALEAMRLGHEPFLLSLPSRLGAEDEAQVCRAGIQYLPPPSLPPGVIKSPGELARLAPSEDEVWRAYHSFLVAPLSFQYPKVLETMERLKPDVLIYDLLVYSAPLAARALKIPDIGFCAGLKLIAPARFQTTYQNISSRLENRLSAFLESVRSSSQFKHLELLSERAQIVFSTEKMIGRPSDLPPRTHLVGPIHASTSRGDLAKVKSSAPKEDFAVLSFGSVFDPADFPEVTDAIIRGTREFNLKLFISSKKLKTTARHVVVEPYLPLPALLPHTKVFFHHGGANSFSEATLYGAPQVLIPLATDQPIQGHFLKQAGFGFSLSPREVTNSTLKPILTRFLDKSDGVHRKISEAKADYQSRRGQGEVIRLMEQIVGGLA